MRVIRFRIYVQLTPEPIDDMILFVKDQFNLKIQRSKERIFLKQTEI